MEMIGHCPSGWDRIDAPMTIDGALDGASFLAYLEQVLAPTLSAGETVLMDNVCTHKVAGVKERVGVDDCEAWCCQNPSTRAISALTMPASGGYRLGSV